MVGLFLLGRTCAYAVYTRSQRIAAKYGGSAEKKVDASQLIGRVGGAPGDIEVEEDAFDIECRQDPVPDEFESVAIQVEEQMNTESAVREIRKERQNVIVGNYRRAPPVLEGTLGSMNSKEKKTIRQNNGPTLIPGQIIELEGKRYMVTAAREPSVSTRRTIGRSDYRSYVTQSRYCRQQYPDDESITHKKGRPSRDKRFATDRRRKLSQRAGLDQKLTEWIDHSFSQSTARPVRKQKRDFSPKYISTLR